MPRTCRFLIASTLLLAVALRAPRGLSARGQAPLPDGLRPIRPETLTAHLHALAVEIGARPAGSAAEAEAAAYVAQQFESWGYAVEIQEFAIGAPGDDTSRNVIARLPAAHPGADLRPILVGAHLDSATEGTGADDNASGVAALLAAAEAVAGLETVRPITFVAFGAEEMGQLGAAHYAQSLGEAGLDDLLVMINVDTVGAGDTAYIYAGAPAVQSLPVGAEPGPTWARDLALNIGAALGYDFRTSPPDGWNGFIGAWSDHAPFAARGVPVVYFERWNWDAGADPSWGQETAEGDILHTPQDQFASVDVAKMMPVAATLAALVATLATDATAPIS